MALPNFTYNLKFNNFTIDIDCFNLKINSNCTDKSIRISVILKGNKLQLTRSFFLVLQNVKEDKFFRHPSHQSLII